MEQRLRHGDPGSQERELDEEHLVVAGDEVGDLVIERKGPDPQGVEYRAVILEGIERLLSGLVPAG